MRIKIIILLVASIILMYFPANPAAAEESNQGWRISQVSSDLYGLGLTYSNGQYIAVGKDGNIITSTDAVKWTKQLSGAKADLYAVVKGPDKYVAVGDGGTAALSADGLKWETASTGIAANLRGVAWGAGQFVAVGDGGTIVTSKDGSNWKKVNSDLQTGLNAIQYVNNQFIAVGDNGIILTSPDGTGWKKQNSPDNSKLLSVSFTAGSYVAVGAKRTILVSNDGEKWSKIAKTKDLYVSHYSIAGNGKDFVTVGNYSNLTYSAGKENWVDVEYAFADIQPMYSAVWGDNKFVAVGMNSIAIVTEKSRQNKQSFYKNEVAGDLYGIGIVYNRGMFVSVGKEGIIKASPDGFNWSESNSGVKQSMNGITYGADQFVAVGDGGSILTSSDAKAWSKQASPMKNNLNHIAYAKGVYVAVGESGTIATSSDGITWTKRESGVSEALNGIAFGKSQFVAVGNGGVILTSSNGEVWERQKFNRTYGISTIAWGNDKFVAFTNYGRILVSKDASDWVIYSLPADTYGMDSVIWTGNRFAATGSAGYFATSPDGEDWQFDQLASRKRYGAIAYDGNNFVAVGDKIMANICPDVKILLNGKELKSDVQPVIIGGRTLVPVRVIFEALGAKVDWDGNTNTVTGTGNGSKVVLRINSQEAYVNDEVKTLDVPAALIGGRAAVPVRFISESLGAKVEWDDKTNTVIITSN